jgi:Predicted DNA-binding protein containing a Zn-ribbon domain
MLHIGIDDTDTTEGGCTTYVASILIENLKKAGFDLFDYPYLVRLNPNIPFKTRGNAAVCIRIIAKNKDVIPIITDTIERLKIFKDIDGEKPQPVICFYEGNITHELEEFYKRCLIEVVDIKDALKIVEKYNIKYLAFRKGIRGLVGAVAAIGALFKEGYTYELIAYRKMDQKSLIRPINLEKVKELDIQFKNFTFHNLDYGKNRILITPHGKDPVLYGIRGKDPEVLLKFSEKLGIKEYIERIMIFKTNQGTNIHLKVAKGKKLFKPYCVVNETFEVIEDPIVIKGGHVLIKVKSDGNVMTAAVYKESGKMNILARYLKKGDLIEIGGGIRKEPFLTINCEKIVVKKLAKTYKEINPYCITCGSKMESEGKGKGLRCKNCSYTIPFSFKLLIEEKRPLEENLILVPPPRSRRHLSEPIPEISYKSKSL